VLVPKPWLAGDRAEANGAGLGFYSFQGYVEGDSLRAVPKSRMHVLPADSLVVWFSGWHGRALALMARDGDGFSGSAFVVPRYDAPGLPSVRVQLRASGCPVATAMTVRSENRFLDPVVPAP
jgi:hypothetical protein